MVEFRQVNSLGWSWGWSWSQFYGLKCSEVSVCHVNSRVLRHFLLCEASFCILRDHAWFMTFERRERTRSFRMSSVTCGRFAHVIRLCTALTDTLFSQLTFPAWCCKAQRRGLDVFERNVWEEHQTEYLFMLELIRLNRLHRTIYWSSWRTEEWRRLREQIKTQQSIKC